jgi:arylsulfatase A-like enzyme
MQSRKKRKSNILFIITDDQQFDAIGALGNDQIHTPEIDRLVSEGVSFSYAYIMGGNQPAVCCPSRAMIHTGRTLYRTGCDARGRITEDVVTIAETFRKAGYRTFATGKQHNGSGVVARGFTDAGKLLFAGMGHHMHLTVHDFDPSGEYHPKHGKVVPRYSSEMFTDAALDFLNQDRGNVPFFMYLAYTVPHDPIMAPRKYMSLYNPDSIRLHPTFRPSHPVDVSPDGDHVRPMQSCDECESDAVVKYHKWPIDEADMRTLVAGYYAMLTHLDNQIGRIRAMLEEKGEWDNTIVVFTSDNGIAMGRHGCYHKQTSHDHDAHVPLVMAGPGIPKGDICDNMVYLYDLFPTLCDLTGLTTPASVEGCSLLPMMQGTDMSGRRVLYHAYVQNWRAVSDGRYRFLIYAGKDEENGAIIVRRFLFDIKEDPMEANDLSEDRVHADNVRRLEALLIEQRYIYGDPVVAGGFWEKYESEHPTKRCTAAR